MSPASAKPVEVKVGDRVIRIDFAWVRLLLGLEPRGLKWHWTREAFQNDTDRSNDRPLHGGGSSS